MKLKNIKEWIESLPIECLEFEVMNAEEGNFTNDAEDIFYRLDKPIVALTVSKETKEVLFLNEKIGDKNKFSLVKQK